MRKIQAMLSAVAAIAAVTSFCAVLPSEDYLEMSGEETLSFERGEAMDITVGEFLDISSGSDVTIKVSGLPSGIKYNSRTGLLSGAPTKDGVYYVNFSAKNANGFTHSFVSTWSVGNVPIGYGDYDDIQLWDGWLDVFDGLRTGEGVSKCGYYLNSVSGLPTGLKYVKGSLCSGGACTACSGFIVGTPTKAGKFKITFTDSSRNKAVKTVVVRDSGCRYLNVQTGFDYGGRGTVKGSKVYAVGAKASISAKPAKWHYFAGWYVDSDCTIPLYDTKSGDYRKASDSVVVTDDLAESGIWAKFVMKNDDYVSIDCESKWNVETAYDGDSLYFTVDSATLPTVSVKGLPPGIKFDKANMCLYVPDLSKLKPGTKDVTISAKNLSGNLGVKTVSIAVPNLESWVFDGIDYASDAYNLTVGVSDSCVPEWLNFEYDSSYKVTASGVPAGLKMYFVDGRACLRGTPTKAGTYTVTLTAKSGRYTEKATFTINVEPQPDSAVGTFNGVLRDDGNNVVGTFVFTTTANGKQSVKITTEYGKPSLSANGWDCIDDGTLSAYFHKSTSSEELEFSLELSTAAPWNCAHHLSGSFSWWKSKSSSYIDLSAGVDTAQRNPFSKTGRTYDNPVAVAVAGSLASEYKSMKMVVFWDDDLQAYRIECADCVEPSEYDAGTATLKMNKNGTAMLSGKLEGQSFTASSMLTFDTECGFYGSYINDEHCYVLFTPLLKGSANDCCGLSLRGIVPIYWLPCD